MDVLITAGATRNPVDAVRVLTANASGRTGVQVGRALAAQGLAVHVLGSPEAALRAEAADLPAEVYGDTHDLMARMRAHVQAHPGVAVVHSAAVGDYELQPDAGGPGKIPSGRDEVVLRLRPTPKIADAVRSWGATGCFVTFKAAPPATSDVSLVQIAQRQRQRTRSDLVFANVLGRLDAGVWIISDDPHRYEKREEAIQALIQKVAAGVSSPSP